MGKIVYNCLNFSFGSYEHTEFKRTEGGSKYIAHGNALGIGAPPIFTPCKGKSIIIFKYVTNLLPFQGEIL